MAGYGWVSWLACSLAIAWATSCAEANRGGDSASSSVAGGKATRPPPTADGLPVLGRACRDAGACGDFGLHCLSASEDHRDGPGSPPGGVCTADCTTDADCRVFDVSAVCATLAEAPLALAYAKAKVARLCMQGCSLGAPSGPTKCQGRSDFACRPFAPVAATTCLKGETCGEGTFCFRGVCRETACGPRCNADADCSGRYCNPLTGLCDAARPNAVQIGANCPGDLATTDTCGGGICLDVDDAGRRVKLTCTQSCTLGGKCGEGQGACVSPRIDNHGIGDAGYCLQRCDCDGDCLNSADHCLPWGDALTADNYDSQGYCDYAVEGTTTLSCTGGAGGAPN